MKSDQAVIFYNRGAATNGIKPVTSNSSVSFIEELGQMVLLRIPDQVYQMFCDMANAQCQSLAMKQARIFKELKEYIEDRYKGKMGIFHFIDLNKVEARELNKKMVRRFGDRFEFTWGMYVFLLPEADMSRMTVVDPMDLLISPQNRIQNGQDSQENPQQESYHAPHLPAPGTSNEQQDQDLRP